MHWAQARTAGRGELVAVEETGRAVGTAQLGKHEGDDDESEEEEEALGGGHSVHLLSA